MHILKIGSVSKTNDELVSYQNPRLEVVSLQTLMTGVPDSAEFVKIT